MNQMLSRYLHVQHVRKTQKFTSLCAIKGIIQVASGPEDTEEEQELVLLRKIQKFEPFIQEQDKGFSIEHLLRLKSKESKSKDHNKEVQGRYLYIYRYIYYTWRLIHQASHIRSITRHLFWITGTHQRTNVAYQFGATDFTEAHYLRR